MPSSTPSADSAALARGGRTNFFGFLLRLSARFPFLVIAARLYGAQELGRFAYATMAVELAAALSVIGLKRGLALEMARGRSPSHVLADAVMLVSGLSLIAIAVLLLFPVLIFPDGMSHESQRFLAFVVPCIALSDVTLAGLAYRHRIGAAVTARSIVEPWVLTICSVILAFTPLKHSGLLIAYFLSMAAACFASVRPAVRAFPRPEGWRPSFHRCRDMARRNLPLAGAETVEWFTRRLDVFILGRFVGADVIGIYYVAQQVATLAGKVRSSFDPILAPMLSTALHNGRREQAAGHIRQVGFWLVSIQFPIVLALGLPAEGVLGLFGPAFATGGAVLALLLVAELAAANGSLSEMALIYAAPRQNLLISLSGLMLQAAITVVLVHYWGAAGAAAGLAIALLCIGIAKQLLLRRRLDARVAIWRWSLLAASVPAFILGIAARRLPEISQMLVTIPGVLILFGFCIWKFGYGPDDRMLFARQSRIRR